MSQKNYDDIVESISYTATYMENHLGTFSKMEEEHIRDHILSMMNGILAIRGTVETFNGKGKTDILFTYKEDNIFIADCKIWRGRKEFKEAVGQLERYLGWNDAKTALIVFYRDKGSMSEKIAEMRDIIKSLPNCRTDLTQDKKRGGRFLMDHPQDNKKSYYLELIVFNYGQGQKSNSE